MLAYTKSIFSASFITCINNFCWQCCSVIDYFAVHESAISSALHLTKNI